jgi:hypothetical protein
MADARAPGTPFQKLAAALGATMKSDAPAAGESFTLHRDEAILDVTLAQGAPPCLVLRGHEEEAAPSSGFRRNVLARARARQVYPTLDIRRVASLDRINMLFAFRFEVRTGDPAFDRAVTVEADFSDDVLAQAFGAKEARQAILDILAAGFTVHFEERAIRADLLSPSDAYFTAATISPVADALAKLVTLVPRVDPATFTKRPQMGRVIVGTIVAAGLVAAGALAPGTLDDSAVPLRPIPRPTLPLPQMLPGIALGAGLFVLAYLVLRWIIKRRNTWTDLPLMMALLVVMGSLGVGLLDAGNRVLDDADLEVHDGKVIAKDTNKSRKSGAVTEWLLVVPSWKPPSTQIELSVDSNLHRAVRMGDTLRISVHPGFFGWPWGAVVERVGGATQGTDSIPDRPGDPLLGAPGGDGLDPRPGRERPNRPPRPDPAPPPDDP